MNLLFSFFHESLGENDGTDSELSSLTPVSVRADWTVVDLIILNSP